MIKKTIILAIAAAGIMLASFIPKETPLIVSEEQPETVLEAEAASSTAENFILDPKKSKIDWVGKGATKSHNGTLEFKSGQMWIDTKQIKSGYFYVDMRTITNKDIKDAGFNKQLVDDLKSDNFFNTNKFPQSSFKITKAVRLDVPDGQINYNISGELTMKGVMKPIEFPALVSISKSKASVKADITIDRTKWGITYNSGNYFKDLGDKLIEDNFTLKVNIETEVK